MKDLTELDKKHFIHPTSSIKQQQENGPKLMIEKGDGIYLTDRNGKTYIDAMSSLWNVNIGHGRKELADAASAQMQKLAYSSAFATFSHEPAILLAEKIASLAPGDLQAVFFTSGGSESNDTAFKLARHYWKIQGKPEKRTIISLKRGYHGVAAGSTSATGIPEFWEMAGHMMTGFSHAGTHYEKTADAAIQSLHELIEKQGADKIAAFIAEPVQCSGGVLIPPDNYFTEIRRLCNEHDILFIADEVITGFGRTGKMFGIENYGVVPDMMTFAKGVTSGYIQLGGVIVSEKIHNMLKEKSEGTLFHGFTYSGHPTAAAVALKNIEIIEKEGLAENAGRMGTVLQQAFENVKSRLGIVGEVRTLGLLGAVELVKNPLTNERFAPDLQVAPIVIDALQDKGVICRSVTYDGTDIICFAPPLIMDEQQIYTMTEKLYEAVLFIQEQLNIHFKE